MFLRPPPVDQINIADIHPAQFDIQASPQAMRVLMQALFTKYDAYYASQFEQHMQAQQAQFEQHMQAHEAKFEQRVQSEVIKRVQVLYEQLVLSRRHMFGRSSEARKAASGRLFDEADTLATTTNEADNQVELPASQPNTRGRTQVCGLWQPYGGNW